MKHPAGRAFLELSDLAFSPDGSQLAFVGLSDAGRQDIYLVSTEGGTARQLTDDPYAERDLAFGDDAIYYASDATDHGRFNLFRIALSTGEKTRLTTGDWNDGHPRPLSDGSLVFSSTAAGKPDLYRLRDGAVRRVTDFATGLTSPSVSEKERGIFAGTFYRGRFRLLEVPRLAWLDDPPLDVAAAASPPFAAPKEEFPQTVTSYSAYRWSNWRPEAGILFGGGGGGSVAGEAAALFTDVLRDHLLYLDVAVYGSFDFTEGVVVFENREGRIPGPRLDHWDRPTLDVGDSNLSFFQREVGAFATLRIPLDRFRRLELEMAAGAVERYCLTDFSVDLPIECGGVQENQAAAADWRARNGGLNLQLGPAVRYGYDTLRYDPFTGPLAGNSLWLEVGGHYFPGRGALNAYARLDAEQYWEIDRPRPARPALRRRGELRPGRHRPDLGAHLVALLGRQPARLLALRHRLPRRHPLLRGQRRVPVPARPHRPPRLLRVPAGGPGRRLRRGLRPDEQRARGEREGREPPAERLRSARRAHPHRRRGGELHLRPARLPPPTSATPSTSAAS